MLSLILAVTLASDTGTIERSPYGVPLITAPSEARAFHLLGKAMAEDRLWQMELSRGIARGRVSRILGDTGLASDRSTLRRAYTEAELSQQFEALPGNIKEAFREYSNGVNETIKLRTEAKTLPEGYAAAQVEPEPWTPIDSCAIHVMLSRQFGAGGAGELRNLTLYYYLLSRPIKDQVLDVIDDLSWQNDPRSIPTVLPEDDPVTQRLPKFPNPTRKQTEAHLAMLPKSNLFELAPALQLASNEATTRVAANLNVVSKVGSYAMVVSPQRSATGWPLLLTAPQMGHSSPSVVYEAAISTPKLKVSGILVPGTPIVVIGHTPNFAWGLTSGVADIEDVFVSDLVGDSTYRSGNETRSLEQIPFEIPVKGKDAVKYNQLRTVHGPVLLNSKANKAVYSQKMAYWKREIASISGLFELYSAKNSREIDQALGRIAVTFNFFYATTAGEIGYRYVGLMPVRSTNIDPRFPTPDRPEMQWQGFLTRNQMPHSTNPKSGLIANWNNKPASWWPNLDTPVWGRIFRNEVLLQSLTRKKLAPWDLERAAWDIARRDTDTNSAFVAEIQAMISAKNRGQLTEADHLMLAYDGWDLEGSRAATLYKEVVRQLRRELFLETLGNFTQDNLFVTVIQPSVMLNALEKKTNLNYLGGRSRQEVVAAAYARAVAELNTRLGPISVWGFVPGSIRVPGQPNVPYGNRGTYIQVTELTANPVARSIASPGIQEVGAHSQDQVPLLRAWTMKPVFDWNAKK